MSQTVLLPFFGGELSSFDVNNSRVTEDTTSGTFSSTFSRCALLTVGEYAFAKSPVWASASPFWFHTVLSASQGYVFSSDGPVVTFYSGSTVVAQLVMSITSSGYTLQLQTLQSGVLTNVGSAVAFSNSTLYTLDIQLTAGASGSATFYVNSTQQFTSNGLNHSAWTGVTNIVLLGCYAGSFSADYPSYCWWSQVICDNSSTLGRNLFTITFTNESATNNQWGGAGGANNLANISTTAASDATYIYAGSSGLTDTFYGTGLSLTGYYVLAVGVAARARVQGSGPANIKMVVRLSSANYISPQFALTPGFTAITYVWTNNPSTSTAWTPTAAAGVEVGVQSLT